MIHALLTVEGPRIEYLVCLYFVKSCHRIGVVAAYSVGPEIMLFWMAQAFVMALISGSILAQNDPDVIVVGSGPGGTGFILRLLDLQPQLKILWLEKGPDKVVSNWPEELEGSELLTPLPARKKMNWLRVSTTVPAKREVTDNLEFGTQAFSWNAFGGM